MNDSNSISTARQKAAEPAKLQDMFTAERMRDCEAILGKPREGVFKDALGAWEAILVNFMVLSSNPEKSPTIVKVIARDAFIVKEKLGAIGYSLGAQIADSLYEFAAKDKNPQYHAVIYSKHIDTINTIIKFNLKGDGGAAGKEMTNALSILIKKIA